MNCLYSVITNSKYFLRWMEMCHLWISHWKFRVIFHQSNQTQWEIYSIGSAACKLICKAGLTLFEVIFIKLCQAHVNRSDETGYVLSIFHHILSVKEKPGHKFLWKNVLKHTRLRQTLWPGLLLKMSMFNFPERITLLFRFFRLIPLVWTYDFM